MKTSIREYLNDPEQLEQLYRKDKTGFKTAFKQLYPDIANTPAAAFWQARLRTDLPPSESLKQRKDVVFLILSSLVAAFLIKLPQIFKLTMDETLFYGRNAGWIVLTGLSLFAFLSKPRLHLSHLLLSISILIISIVYINLLPYSDDAHSVILALVHLPLVLWCIYGLIFVDFEIRKRVRWLEYIKYNGDVAILSALILIAGGILTGVSLGLFSAIDLHIEDFYAEYIIIPGLVSVPIVATFIGKRFPAVTLKLAPILSGIFSPLVLITLLIYLASILLTGKDPYNDRDFLIIFNLMLVGVLAIIVFSVSGTSDMLNRRFSQWILLLLSFITLLVDIIALSAIVYRLGEFGFSPNKTVALLGNLVILGHLVWISRDLLQLVLRRKDMHQLEQSIAGYLPVYFLYAILVTFLLPFVFGFR